MPRQDNKKEEGITTIALPLSNWTVSARRRKYFTTFVHHNERTDETEPHRWR